MGLKGITTRVSGTQKVTLVKGGGGGGQFATPPHVPSRYASLRLCFISVL